MTEQLMVLTNQGQIETYYDTIEQFREGKLNHDNAKVGQTFAIAERNVKAVKRALDIKTKEKPSMNGIGLFKIQETDYSEIEKECFIRTGYSIWEVIQPSKLLPYKGQWSRETWVPEILHGGRWIKADDKDCKNWLSIPVENRRVLFCIGIIEEE